jgi:transglutaminase-like putative cysteine protease
MTRYGLCSAVLLLAGASPCLAEGKPLLETWQAGYFEGLKVGHIHTVSRETTRGGKKVIRTLQQMELVIKRYGSVLPVHIEQVSEETSDGKVLSLQLTQYLAKDAKRTTTGVVKGGKLALTTNADDSESLVPWNDEAVGYYTQQTICAQKKIKPDDTFKMVAYELMLRGTMTFTCTAKKEEKTDRLVEKKEGKEIKVVREPATLLRVEMVPDKIPLGEREVQLPTNVIWLDAKRTVVRQQFEFFGIGQIIFYNTTKEAALKEGVAPELLPDLGLSISIPLKETIDDPYNTTKAVYRITLKEKLDKVFAQDARQQVVKEKGKSLELVVKSLREPKKVENPIEPGKEYLESNQFIDSDNPRVKATAKKIVGAEEDAWKKSKKLEKWVSDNMKPSTATGFPSASQVCRDLEGDCRQHAILLAGLCRASGIPARTAVGMIYARKKGQSPFFAFHMWTEVCIDGQWLALDAVLGQGGVGATHLKMADHSWSKTATLAPLLPVAQALGKIQIEVVSAK